MLSPQEMAEDTVAREFPGAATSEVQRIGADLYSVILYAEDGFEGEMRVQAVATVQIRGVVLGEPVLVSVAQSEG